MQEQRHSFWMMNPEELSARKLRGGVQAQATEKAPRIEP
jgi:hypothetical protein